MPRWWTRLASARGPRHRPGRRRRRPAAARPEGRRPRRRRREPPQARRGGPRPRRLPVGAKPAGRPRVPRLDHRPAVLPARELLRARTRGEVAGRTRQDRRRRGRAGHPGRDGPGPGAAGRAGHRRGGRRRSSSSWRSRLWSRRRPGRRRGRSAAAKVRRAVRNGVETVHLGDEFHAARVGSVLYVSNKEAALNAGLDLKPGNVRSPTGRGRRPPASSSAATRWRGCGSTSPRSRRGSRRKDFFEATRKDLFQTLIFGSTADAFRRADFVAAGLYQHRRRVHRHGPAAGEARRPARGARPARPAAGQTRHACRCSSRRASSTARASTSTSAHLWKHRKTLINEQTAQGHRGGREAGLEVPPRPVGRQAAGDVRAVPPARRRPTATRSRTR